MKQNLRSYLPFLFSILGVSPARRSEPHAGAGTARRKEREAAYRIQQAERLSAAAGPSWTRQTRRQAERLAAKGRTVTL